MKIHWSLIALILAVCQSWGETTDGPATLPMSVPVTQQSLTPSSNIPIYVPPAGTSLQAVLNSAKPGDTITIDPMLTGSISNLPCGANGQYITIRTSSTLIPDEYTRISPAFAGVASLPGRPAYVQPTGGAARLMPQLLLSAQNSSITGGCLLRLIGLEITRPASTTPGGPTIVYNLMRALGHDIIIDRCWFHGTATDETTRGILLSDAQNVAIINSYFSDFHCRAVSGACGDSQAVAGGTSSNLQDGPFVLRNNFFEAAGENVIFGGGGAAFVPNDITIQYNVLFKPMTWNQADPSYDGGTAGRDGVKHPWWVKNHLELKNANRVLVEGNTLQNVWGGFSQVGASALVTPKNQAGANGANVCPICSVTNVTFRYDLILYAAQAFQIACAPSDNGGWPAGCGNFEVHDVLAQYLQYPTCHQCGSFTNLIGSAYSAGNTPIGAILNNVDFHNVTLESVGWITPAQSGAASMANGVLNVSAIPVGALIPQNTGMHFWNNVFDPGNYGVYPTGGGASNCFVASGTLKVKFTNCWPGGSFTGNVFTSTIPFKGPLPWPDGNGVPNPNAGVNMAALQAALANQH